MLVSVRECLQVLGHCAIICTHQKVEWSPVSGIFLCQTLRNVKSKLTFKGIYCFSCPEQSLTEQNVQFDTRLKVIVSDEGSQALLYTLQMKQN